MSELIRRQVTEADASDLLSWRNNSLTIGFQRNSQIIEFPEHIEWLKKRITNLVMNPFYVYESRGIIMVFVRYDYITLGEYEVSIIVNPSFRNQGMASFAIQDSIEDLRLNSSVQKILASVHVNNSASMTLFQKIGFLPVLDNPSDKMFKIFVKAFN